MNPDMQERLKILSLRELFKARDSLTILVELGLADIDLYLAVKQEIASRAE